MSWLGGIGAGLSSLGNAMKQKEAEKREREERLKSIRDKLSLVNAQAPEKKRVIPGQELPADVAGPPAPEMVETFKTSLEYDPEKGYVAKDEVLGSQRNQWSTTDQDAKKVGDKILKRTTQTDLAGNQRTNFDEEDAAQKLKKERILQGDQMVDVMMNESGEIVNELGRGGRYRPAGAGRSPEEMRADADYRHNLTMERERERQRLDYENDIARSAGAAMGDWREMNARQKEAYNAGLGLPPDAKEQDVRTALRKRIMEDRAAPASEVAPEPSAKPAPVPESDSPFKRKPGGPPPDQNPMAKDDPKPKVADKPADNPKEEPKKEDKGGVKFDDPVMQKNFEEDEAEFRRILSLTQGKEARDKLIADYQRQMMELYDVRFK